MTSRSVDRGAAVVRRAPFSDNPRVGARGQRTQQRILDAALRVFAEDGYHRASIDRIAKLGGCSRVSFYQYFASKEDVFRNLLGQVERQVGASIEALDPVTPDVEGWTALRAWIARFAEVYARYEPVFNAVETDDELARVAGSAGDDTVARFHARLATTTKPPRHLNAVVRLLLECLNHTLEVSGVLRSVTPDAYPEDAVERAFTDIAHRTLFGRRDDVNVHGPDRAPPPELHLGPAMLDMLGRADEASDVGANRALDALLTSGRDVFVERGYHTTRVDDLVTAAGVSHGAFYRYFRNKDELAQILTGRAMQHAAGALAEIPDVLSGDPAAGRSALRVWLRRYVAAQAQDAAMLRVWLDAALQDPRLRAESAPPLDWGRRRMAEYLAPRGFGDVDMEAVVVVALLGVLGARPRAAAAIDAAAEIIERGLLGR